MVLYTWSAIFPVLIYLILQLNKISMVVASAVGVIVQCGQVIIGATHTQLVGGYILSILPAVGFFENWVHWRRVQKQRTFL